MNISYNWLKDYLQFDLSPRETADALTSIGLETGGVEEIETIRGGLQGLVVGEVITCEAHPNSDHLHLTTVDIGDGREPLRIVCGAPNVAAGQKVIVATVGTKLYSGDEEFTIKRSKIRGEESFGMICAEDEIGIGTSHHGIIVLPPMAEAGMTARQYFNVKTDYVLEVDITPNRIDASSHYGVARDLAAYLHQARRPYELTRPPVDDFVIDQKDGGINISVQNTDACRRYSGLTIRGITVRESPDWLKNRLLAIGLRPINNVVDITNFVLHETGHPMHAFDAAKISGGRIIVRTLPDKTPFVTLDGQARELSDKDLMICNAHEGMCIAGVFGGLGSGVTESTKEVFIEVACFDPSSVRKTARRHALSTDSSFRFERGVDPNDSIYVVKRAALLIQEMAGGEIVGEIRDIYPAPVERPRVQLSFEKANLLIGKEIDQATIISILKSLEMEIESQSPSALTLRVPTYRVDVLREVDVIEDMLRIYGYNNVGFSQSLKANLSYQTATDRKHALQTLVSEQLTAGGFHEIVNNSFTRKAFYETSQSFPASRCIALLNPLSSDLNVMRQTLIFGGLESIAHNRNRKNNDLRLYEFGNCYFFDDTRKDDDNALAPYSEETHLAIWMCGKRNPKNWAAPEADSSIFEMKAHIENIFARLGLPPATLQKENATNDVLAEAVNIRSRERPIATWGAVHEKWLKTFDIDTPVFFAEINWDAVLKETAGQTVQFAEIPKFPSVKRDLALLIDRKVTFEEIEQIARKSEKKLLKDISLFDVYEGPNLPEGKKSYAVNFVLIDTEKTLTDKQIDAVMHKIQSNLEHELGAQLR